MNIAVCDDEEIIRKSITKLVSLTVSEVTIFEYKSGTELINAQEKFDIVFLDIKMPGISGLETARLLRKRQERMEIIFITGLEEYVFEAFDVGAFHYLIKPFSKPKFLSVLQKALQKRRQTVIEETIISEAVNPVKSIIIKTGAVKRRVLENDIYAAEVRNRKVILYTREGELEYYANLTEVEKELGDRFYRCHRAYLAAFEHIESYDSQNITLENGMVIPIAKQKYAGFVKAYLLYIKNRKRDVKFVKYTDLE